MSESAYAGTGYDEDEDRGVRPGDRRTSHRPASVNPGEEYYADVDTFTPPGAPRGGPMYAGVYVLENDEQRGINGDRWRPDPSWRGRGPRNWTRADPRILDDVCVRLTEDAVVDASRIDVAVEAGEVTLTGVVRDKRQKRRAEDVAWNVPGVTDVHTQLKIMR